MTCTELPSRASRRIPRAVTTSGSSSPRGDEARRLVSLVPRGAREGETHRALGRTFALVVGRPARFDLFASDDARTHSPGEVVPLDDAVFLALPPVAINFENEGA